VFSDLHLSTTIVLLKDSKWLVDDDDDDDFISMAANWLD